MTDQDKTRPQTTTGGPLDIREEHGTPIGSDAGLKGKVTPAEPARASDVETIRENVEGDRQHHINSRTMTPQTCRRRALLRLVVAPIKAYS